MTRQEAIEYLKMAQQVNRMNPYTKSVDVVAEEVVDMAIKALDSQRTGEWIYEGLSETVDRLYKCSECGFVLDDFILGVFFNFCPNCGADMRGEKDG